MPECQNEPGEATAADVLARMDELDGAGARMPETAGSVAGDTGDTEIAETEWRYEVSHRGRYWGWRKGSGKNRVYRNGGRWETMPEKAQEAYHAHVAQIAQRYHD